MLYEGVLGEKKRGGEVVILLGVLRVTQCETPWMFE